MFQDMGNYAWVAKTFQINKYLSYNQPTQKQWKVIGQWKKLKLGVHQKECI